MGLTRFLAALAATLLVGCAAPPETPQPAAVAVVDDVGREVRLERPATRVVSLIPWVTETIVELGARDRLVARTTYDTDPSLAELPSLGGGLTPSLEWLAALSPDLVVAWPDQPSRSIVDRLEAIGIPVYAARAETLSDASAVTRKVSTLLDLEAEADALLAGRDSVLAALEDRMAARDRPTVFYAIGIDPPMAAGPRNFIHELISYAGARNLFGDASSRWPAVSMEEVVRRQPDAVVVAHRASSSPIERLRTSPGWRQLRAIREGRVLEVDVDVFNRPGPGIAEAAGRLAEFLHPDLSATSPRPLPRPADERL